MTSLRAAFVLCAALFLASCLPVTTSVPVGSTAGFKTDTTLAGTWIGRGADTSKGDNSPAYMHFIGGPKDETMTLVIVSTGGDNGGEYSVYGIKAATLGGNHYLNVNEVSNNGKASGDDGLKQNFPVLYRKGSDGKLTMYLIDEDAAKAAIQSGKLKGTIEAGENGDVHITEDAKALDAYFASPAGVALFKKPLVTLTPVKP